MLIVDNEYIVIAPPMSAMGAMASMLEAAGHEVEYFGRYDLPALGDNRKTVLLYRPYQNWLEAIWYKRRSSAELWTANWEFLEDIHDDQHFSKLGRAVVRKPGCIEAMMRPLFMLSDYVICSHWMHEGMAAITRRTYQRPKRVSSTRGSNRPTAVWHPIGAQGWWESEATINDFEFDLCGRGRNGALQTGRNWPVKDARTLFPTREPESPAEAAVATETDALDALDRKLKSPRKSLDDCKHCPKCVAKPKDGPVGKGGRTMRDALEEAGEWPS